jgi:phage gp46-like protein
VTYVLDITAAPETPVLDFWATLWPLDAAQGAEPLGDWRLEPEPARGNAGGFDASNQLASAVFLSLFTDRRAPEGWRLDVTDRRGWWGDALTLPGEAADEEGSHLWLLRNEIASPETANLARIYAEEALAWLTADRVASSVTVTTGLIEAPRRGIWMLVQVRGRDGALIYDRRFARLWQNI